MEKLLMDCVMRAIQRVGVHNFKKTSLFLSNENNRNQLQKAA